MNDSPALTEQLRDDCVQNRSEGIFSWNVPWKKWQIPMKFFHSYNLTLNLINLN